MGGNQSLDNLSGGEILPRTSAIIDLPPTDTKRWVARCNGVIVNAVRSGASIVLRRPNMSRRRLFPRSARKHVAIVRERIPSASG
jgi:hypothetical protein